MKSLVQAYSSSVASLPWPSASLSQNKGSSHPLYPINSNWGPKHRAIRKCFPTVKAVSDLNSPVKSGLWHLNHQLHAEEDKAGVQRPPNKLFPRIRLPTAIFASSSLASNLRTPQTNSNLWFWEALQSKPIYYSLFVLSQAILSAACRCVCWNMIHTRSLCS